MPKGFYKHQVLLDENMSLRTAFPNLNSKFDVKHVADDLKQGSLGDPDVYQLAVDQKRILVTFNSKQFRKLVGSKSDAGIIGVSANLLPSQIDTKVTALLMRSTPHALRGNLSLLPEKQKYNLLKTRSTCQDMKL